MEYIEYYTNSGNWEVFVTLFMVNIVDVLDYGGECKTEDIYR